MICLVNFYKSSSARQEKTRPVAILSTTLQPYFRFHLNATCAVCAGPPGQVDRGKQIVWKDFGSIFFSPDGCLPADVPEIVSAVSEPFLRGGFLCFEESVGKERGRGEQEECMCCPFWPQISPKSQKCDGQYRRTPVSCVVITRIRRLLPFRSPPTQS